jgi:hypothetical protein
VTEDAHPHFAEAKIAAPVLAATHHAEVEIRGCLRETDDGKDIEGLRILPWTEVEQDNSPVAAEVDRSLFGVIRVECFDIRVQIARVQANWAWAIKEAELVANLARFVAQGMQDKLWTAALEGSGWFISAVKAVFSSAIAKS